MAGDGQATVGDALDSLEEAVPARQGGCRAPIGQAGQQFAGLGLGPGFGDQRGHGHRGEQRPGEQGAAGLLEHHGQLEEPVPLPAPALGEVDAEPSLGRQLLPHRLELLPVGVQEGPWHRRRAVSVEPATGGRLQGLVLFGDGEGHVGPFDRFGMATIVP